MIKKFFNNNIFKNKVFKKDTSLVIIGVVILTIVFIGYSYSAFLSVKSQSSVTESVSGNLAVVSSSGLISVTGEGIKPTSQTDINSILLGPTTCDNSNQCSTLTLTNNSTISSVSYSVAITYDYDSLPSEYDSEDLLSFDYLNIAIYDNTSGLTCTTTGDYSCRWKEYSASDGSTTLTPNLGDLQTDTGYSPVITNTISSSGIHQYYVFVWLKDGTPASEIGKKVYLKYNIKSASSSVPESIIEMRQKEPFTPLSLVSDGDNDIRGKNGISSGLTGGMYRYQGAATETINNYICIGSNTCQTSKMTSSSYDDHTYRILGITEDGRMKVIKMGVSTLGDYSSDSLYWYWNSTGEGKSYDWSNATIRTRLNNPASGYYLSTLGDYASYIDSSSDSKFYSTATRGVSSPSYIPSKSTSGDNQSATNLYALETGGTIASYGADEVDENNISYKVGLMQLSDYYLATSDDANCSYSGGVYSTCTASWIYLLQNDSRKSSEWLISREAANYAWYATSHVWDVTIDYHCSVRPVFYLSSDITLSGSGTTTDPYYIVTN